VKNVDKYEYKVRSEEISKLIDEEKYAEAAKIADTIDWKRVKSSTMLLKISALYGVNKRNEDSRDILLLAYDRYPTNRSVVYSLCDVSIELDDIVSALEYLKQYAKIAPDDSGVYVLHYRILETQDANLDERIELLEALKAKDYQVEWVYELAYLYHRAGYITKCVETCDELILWIGDGPYVMKAMELKALHVPLSEKQQAKYNFMLSNAQSNYSASGYYQDDDQGNYEDEAGYYDENYDNNGNYVNDDYNYDNGNYDNGNYDNDNYDDANYEGYDSNYDENYDENGNYIGDNYDENGNYIDGNYDENGNYIGNETYDSNYDENYNEGYASNYDDNYDENGNYIGNEFYEDQSYDENGNPIEQEDYEQIQEVQPEQAQTQPQRADVDMSQYNTINLQKVVAESMKELFPDDDIFAEEREKLNSEEVYDKPKEDNAISEGSTIIYGKFGADSAKPETKEAELEAEESEIEDNTPMTGQMKIDDVLAEWERLKVDNAKRHQEEIRNQIFSQTGQMLADFDTTVNNDIMAKLDDSSKVTIKGGSIVANTKLESDDTLQVEELGEVEELEEVSEVDEIEETNEETKIEEAADVSKVDEMEDDIAEMSELEKAVASELGGSTQNLPYETIKDIAEASVVEAVGINSAADEDVALDNFEEDYYEENQFEENQFEENEAAKASVAQARRELDPDESDDIAEMAKEDALKTQEIKMNTADLSILSEKIVETTTKEEAGAKREEIRNFSPEEQELFENFAVTKKIKKQIINALDNMSLAAYTGNVIITGDAGLDTIRLAKNLIKEYQSLDSNFSGKIAKIAGDKINDRNIKEIFDKLDNGGIIIEKANGMSQEKLYEMASLLNQENIGIIVILEDTKKEIARLLEKQAMIADYFNIRIDLMEMDNNALVAYAKNYALALEYAIDELGTLALYTRIANMQSGNHVVTKDEVRDIIDEAIYKSKKSKIKNFVDVLFSRRYDSEDMIVLKERDFI
jgi:hypothetical protein